MLLQYIDDASLAAGGLAFLPRQPHCWNANKLLLDLEACPCFFADLAFQLAEIILALWALLLATKSLFLASAIAFLASAVCGLGALADLGATAIALLAGSVCF